MIEQLFPGMTALQNLHPLYVHFPIAFFVGTAVMELAAVFYDERFHFVATWFLYLGIFAAVMSLGSGFGAASSIAASDPRGSDAPGRPFISIHRNWMLLVSTFGIGLAIYYLWVNQNKKWPNHKWRLLIGTLVLSFLISMGADRGGRLVFEFGLGVNPDIIVDPSRDGGDGDSH